MSGERHRLDIPVLGVLCKAEEPSWVVGGPWGPNGRTVGAWRLLGRSPVCWPASRQGEEGLLQGCCASCDHLGKYPQPKPSKRSSPAHPMAQCCPRAGMAMTRRRLKLRCRSTLVPGRAGWGGGGCCWPLVKQLQEPRSPTLAALPQLTSPYTGRKSVRAPPVVAGGFTIGLERQGRWAL